MAQIRGRLIEGRFGPYEILAELSDADTGSLFLARKMQAAEGLDRFVMIREYLPDNPEEEARLVREYGILTQFGHANTPRVEEFIQLDSGAQVAVCEYLNGDSLSYLIGRAIDRKLALTPEIALGIVIQACQALDYAHSYQDTNEKTLFLLHRHVNPDNIVVLHNGEVKLTNFDVVGAGKNQAAYLSPEECMELQPDQRSDIYSMGIVLWEMLTGRHLFKRPDDAETREAILTGQIPALHAVAPEVATELEASVMRALMRNPGQRHDSAKQLAAELQDYLEKTGKDGSPAAIREFFRPIIEERIRERLDSLQEIEASGEQPEDPSLLLPVVSMSFLPLADTAAYPAGMMAELAKPDDSDAEDDEFEETRPYIAEPSRAAPADEEATAEATAVDAPSEEATEVDTRPVEAPVAEAPVVQAPLDEIPEVEVPVKAEPVAEAPPAKPSLWPIVLVACALGIAVAFLVIMLLTEEEEKTEPAAAAEPAKAAVAPMEPAEKPPAPAETPAEEPSDAGLIEEPEKERPAEPAPEPESEKVAAAEEPEKKPGTYLTVLSEPEGCKVSLGKKKLKGTTPLQDVEVRPGRHRVTVYCPQHKKQTKRIRIRKNEQKELSFKPRPSRKTRYGYLRLATKPWVEVYKGEVKLGVTPINRLKMAAGRHTLKLVNQSEGLTKTLQVRIRPGKTTSIKKIYTP